MLKKLIYLSIFTYLAVIYGQNFMEFGSDLRKDFYFIGMALSRSLFALVIYKDHKDFITSFLLFMCIGDFVNEVGFQGSISFFELYAGVIGMAYSVFIDLKKKKDGK